MNIVLIGGITGAIAGVIMVPSILRKQKEAEAKKQAEMKSSEEVVNEDKVTE